MYSSSTVYTKGANISDRKKKKNQFDVISSDFVLSLFQGFDPLGKEPFKPRAKKKGRSSAGAVERRKKKVAYEDQRVFPFFAFSSSKTPKNLTPLDTDNIFEVS